MTAPEGRAKVAYHVLGFAPPARYAEWVRRDIQSSSWLVRRWITYMVVPFVATAIASAFMPFQSAVPVMIGAAIGSTLLFWPLGRYSRWRALRYYEKRWQRQAGF